MYISHRLCGIFVGAIWLSGCMGNTPGPQSAADVGACSAELDSEALEELESRNQGLRAQIRELEGQLAVARTDLRTLRRESQRPATTRIGAERRAESGASAVNPVVEEVPAAERDTARPTEDDEPRIVLRLYGTRPEATPSQPSQTSSRGPLPPLEIPPRPANIPGSLSVTGPPRADAPPPIPIPVAPPVPLASAPTGGTSARPAAASASAPDPAVELYREALTLVRGRQLAQALERLRSFRSNHPRHPYADNALYWQGEVLYMQRRYRDALQAYGGVINQYPRGNRVADSLLKMARCHQRLGNLSQARQLLSRVQAQFPNSVAAQVALREDTT